MRFFTRAAAGVGSFFVFLGLALAGDFAGFLGDSALESVGALESEDDEEEDEEAVDDKAPGADEAGCGEDEVRAAGEGCFDVVFAEPKAKVEGSPLPGIHSPVLPSDLLNARRVCRIDVGPVNSAGTPARLASARTFLCLTTGESETEEEEVDEEGDGALVEHSSAMRRKRIRKRILGGYLTS